MSLRLLPWVRTGLATARGEGRGDDARRKTRLSVSIGRVAVGGGETIETVGLPARLYGPGDVVQLDPLQVIATDPKPFANDFEPNYLATVTFDAPELPWLFSPEESPQGDAPQRLLPWVCLVVVRREAGTISVDPNRPVPTLRLADATGELPDLGESWAWVHAQISGTDDGLSDALSGPKARTERTLSRLISPRRLVERTPYLACVVPAFAAGRQAGLGQEVTAGNEPAWTFPGSGPLELPVYHSWEFTTGAAGDFESLVRRLLPPRPLGPEVGTRDMDISSPGPGLPELEPGSPGSVLGLEGPWRSPSALPSDWPEEQRTEFQNRLQAMLEAGQGDVENVLTLPVYGDVHADAAGVAPASDPPFWLRELNLDPRHRVAAALGARVVREQQEQLMASAWDQAGELARANQLLRQAQLGRAVASSVREKRLQHLDPDTLLRITEPVHARIKAPPVARNGTLVSLHGAVRESAFPEAAVSGPFRRSLRPRGPLGRRVSTGTVKDLVHGLAGVEVPMPMVRRIDGSVDHNEVGEPQLEQITTGVPTADGWRLVVDYREVLGEPAPPHIDAVDPEMGREGDEVAISGSHFRDRSSSSRVRIRIEAPNLPDADAEILGWSEQQVRISVPSVSDLEAAGRATLTLATHIDEFSRPFTVLENQEPRITGLSRQAGRPGDQVTISGVRFGVAGTRGQAVTLANREMEVLSWATAEISVSVPDVGAGERDLVVSTPWGESDPVAFTVSRPPSPGTSHDGAEAPIHSVTPLLALPWQEELPDDVGEEDELRLRRLAGINGRFRDAALELQEYLVRPAAQTADLAAADGMLPVEAMAPQLVGREGTLDPEKTVPDAVDRLLTLPEAARPEEADVLGPVRAAPYFPQPMYEALRAISPERVLPGVEHVPPDTVALLTANPRFIEAYMVGLNHELGREFFWRGLPADPRATFFDRFWDVRGRDPGAPGPPTDIPPITEWDPAVGLGANATRVGGRDMLVVLIRGELVRRYPTTTVYAVKAKTRSEPGSTELYPEFRGSLEPDLAFFGFGLSVAEAAGSGTDPGWFFVVQQQATEPRFGLDEADPAHSGTAPAHWRDLSWAHLVANPEDLALITHVPVQSEALSGMLRDLPLDGATWGRDAAHMGRIVLQDPVRVAIHGAAMLPEVNPAPTPITAVRRAGDRIAEVGGVDAFGEPWRMTEEAAISGIKAGASSYFVHGTLPAEVVVAVRQGREYLKTVSDGELPNNLLELPELPA